jgi:hypothetical protein
MSGVVKRDSSRCSPKAAGGEARPSPNKGLPPALFPFKPKEGGGQNDQQVAEGNRIRRTETYSKSWGMGMIGDGVRRGCG